MNFVINIDLFLRTNISKFLIYLQNFVRIDFSKYAKYVTMFASIIPPMFAYFYDHTSLLMVAIVTLLWIYNSYSTFVITTNEENAEDDVEIVKERLTLIMSSIFVMIVMTFISLFSFSNFLSLFTEAFYIVSLTYGFLYTSVVMSCLPPAEKRQDDFSYAR